MIDPDLVSDGIADYGLPIGNDRRVVVLPPGLPSGYLIQDPAVAKQLGPYLAAYGGTLIAEKGKIWLSDAPLPQVQGQLLFRAESEGGTDVFPLYSGITLVTGAATTGKTTVVEALMQKKKDIHLFSVGEYTAGKLVYAPQSPSILAILRYIWRSNVKIFAVDSLSFLLLMGGSTGSGGISRAAAPFLATLDALLRMQGKSIVLVMNPLTSAKDKAMDAYRELMVGVVSTYVQTIGVGATERGLSVTFTASSRAGDGDRRPKRHILNRRNG